MRFDTAKAVNTFLTESKQGLSHLNNQSILELGLTFSASFQIEQIGKKRTQK